MTHDVFISYANEDQSIADNICVTLEQRKLRCWIAPRDILPGAEFAFAIVDAVREARALVIVFSKNSNNSQHVLREVKEAVENGIPIIPFRIENVSPSKTLNYFLGTSQWLDALSPPLEEHVHRLAEIIKLRRLEKKSIFKRARQPKSQELGDVSTSLLIDSLLNSRKILSINYLSVILIILSLMGSIYFFFIKSPGAKTIVTKHQQQLYTLGYFGSRAVWTAIGGLIFFSASKDGKFQEMFDGELKKSGSDWVPQQCLEKMERISKEISFPSDNFFKELKSTLNKTSIMDFSNQLRSNSPDRDDRDKEISSFHEKIAESVLKILQEAQDNGASDDDLLIIAVGLQVGKIDQVLIFGTLTDEKDDILAVCRPFLHALFEVIDAFGSEEINAMVLSEFPGIQSRIDNIRFAEITRLVNKFNKVYLINMD